MTMMTSDLQKIFFFLLLFKIITFLSVQHISSNLLLLLLHFFAFFFFSVCLLELQSVGQQREKPDWRVHIIINNNYNITIKYNLNIISACLLHTFSTLTEFSIFGMGQLFLLYKLDRAELFYLNSISCLISLISNISLKRQNPLLPTPPHSGPTEWWSD